tara:strand:+ start:364 stop:474 length:111 start_codon:yes stop_codon:yes gene_type:complete
MFPVEDVAFISSVVKATVPPITPPISTAPVPEIISK